MGAGLLFLVPERPQRVRTVEKLESWEEGSVTERDLEEGRSIVGGERRGEG